jgi:hypothetical protein
MVDILFHFSDHPQERDIIGGLLIGYGEIEWALAGCIREAMNAQMNEALRILFRVRGEGPRIDVADAVARPAYNKIGLGGAWGNAIGAARACKNIRNQYAHCHWRRFPNGTLRFINLDQDVTSEAGTPLIADAIRVELDLLQRQKEYFEHTASLLYYLEEAYKKAVGRPSIHRLTEPKSIPAPPPYNRPATASPSSPDTSSGSSEKPHDPAKPED